MRAGRDGEKRHPKDSEAGDLPMFKLVLRYARYALTTLTTIGFGMSFN